MFWKTYLTYVSAMKKRLQSLLILIISLFYSTSSFASAEGEVDSLIQKLSLEEKVGQLLLVGFRGFGVSEEVETAIRDYHVGSVIYFDYDVVTKSRRRNIRSSHQLRLLSEDLQAISNLPLFISVDEEGGKVSRLKSRYGFSKKPSPAELGHKFQWQVRRSAEKLATELIDHGINVNFAPLADVNTNPYNPVIGSLGRSFSEDPKEVEDYCRSFIEGQNKAGVISVLKHFPGHGSSRGDSHEGLVDVSQTWSEKELIPFQNLIASGDADMIMTAHIYNRNLDIKYPATLSKRTIQGLLRNQLGFEGVIISDDMNMGAISKHYGMREAIALSLNAGVDILLFGNNLVYDKNIAAKAHGIVVDLVKKGTVPLARINESLKRVLLLKKKSGIL
ncbi:MAG: glycoside hydrolase family 3 [Halobacteriovoraceae bacterium]|nr:glycoside hydrolase family 3 [Halobacteriovoraceae bacterium]